jgi:hypothetical protein
MHTASLLIDKPSQWHLKTRHPRAEFIMIQEVYGCKQSRPSDIDENAMLVRIRASAGSFTITKATSHTGMPYHMMLGSS